MKEEILIRYIQGTSSIQETQMVMQWINENKENEKYLLEMQHLLNASLEWDSIFHDLETSEKTPRKHYRLYWIKVAAVAASLFIFMAGGWMLAWNTLQYKISQHMPLAECIRVPARQRLDLILSDGTKVCLNANSTLRFDNDWSQKERRVFLDGEAYFEVAHNKERPFIVETNTYDIQVLGTTFNVNAYQKEGNFEVALIEGSVQINDKEDQKLLQLNPNEEAVLDNGYLAKHKTQVKDLTKWTDGILVFNNEPYKTIFKKLEAYYNVEITINDRIIGEYCMTAKFYMDSGLEHILTILQQSNHFKYTWDKRKNHIYVNL